MAAVIISIPYFVAASLVFPRIRIDQDALERNHWENKRIIVGVSIGVGILVFAYLLTVTDWTPRPYTWIAMAMYWLPMLTLLISRKGWLDSFVPLALSLL